MKDIKTKFYIFLLLVFSIQCYSSSRNNLFNLKYYLEIPDSNNIPTVTKNSNGTVTLTFTNSILTNLFKNYIISNFELAFPGGKNQILKIVYIIECDTQLIVNIANNYSTYFGRWEEVQPVQLLLLPNDFGGSSGTSQPELNFLRAQEAWNISTGDNVMIGIAEQTNVFQEDLLGKATNITGTNPPASSSGHGTQVALTAAASTNNGKGISGIGYNSTIKSSGMGYSGLIPLANSGARVINMSWGSCNNSPLSSQYGQLIIDQIWDSGVVVVAAAGNGAYSCPSLGATGYHYPASLNNVISVSGVGHRSEATSLTDGNRKDLIEDFDITISGQIYTDTHNDRVDLNAPSHDIYSVSGNNPLLYDHSFGGTSAASPFVTGTIALMFSANPCLFPNEVESILKLTAFKNDQLTQNLPYQGQMGAGRLDSFLAVDMAKDMQLSQGTVEIQNRIINRWNFNLRTAPFEIKLNNNDVTNIATIDFTARNNIEILNFGDYSPTSTGFIDLKVNSINGVCNTPIQIPTNKISNEKNKFYNNQNLNKLYPNPNKGIFTVNLNRDDLENITINIFNILGEIIYTTKSKVNSFEINIPNLESGIYLVKISNENYNETLKFIKE